ncbi:MAG TPA: ABC transporter permease subunit [Ignavibacteriaceae bacterium]|nr:ABC transporter permease subunit [Ignavibacteriaceae bacterium]
MNNIWITTWYTVREALARKVFLFFLGLSALAIIITAVMVNVLSDSSLISGVAAQNNKLILEEIASSIQLIIIAPLASLCILLSIFSSASFVPHMLEKGNIDLLLSKPISRTQLLLGKYFGGLLVVLINVGFLIIGVWFVIALRFSTFNFTFLNVILSITFTFGVLYSLIVLFGIVTQGSILGMMSAYFIFLILSPLLYAGKNQFSELIKNDFLKSVIDFFYYTIPKTSELMGEITVNIALGKGINDWQPVLTSFAFLIAALSYAVFIFRKKDF